MTRSLLQFKNCNIVRDNQIIAEDLWVRDRKIVDPEKIFFDEKNYADRVIDCKGALVSPGFIELQINGGFGVDFSCDIEDIEASIGRVAKGILAHGVTSFCPTIVTSPINVYQMVLPKIMKKPGGHHGATILGAHVEGPFINPSKKGAHPEEYIRKLDKGFGSILEVCGSLDNVKIITIAPELENACDVVQQLVKNGVTVSLGHSMANLSEGEAAVKHGASFITHLFNAMLPFHHRDPGLVGLLTSDALPNDRVMNFGLISDGIHTHPAALRIAHRANPKGLVLVTDAISALGLEEGMHQLGQLKIEVKNRCAYVAGTDTLCGSIATMIECVKFFKQATGCSTVEALEAATYHPARTIGIDKVKGTLNYGSDADFIFLGEDLDIWSTWIGGECVYQAENKPRPSVTIKEQKSFCKCKSTL